VLRPVVRQRLHSLTVRQQSSAVSLRCMSDPGVGCKRCRRCLDLTTRPPLLPPPVMRPDWATGEAQWATLKRRAKPSHASAESCAMCSTSATVPAVLLCLRSESDWTALAWRFVRFALASRQSPAPACATGPQHHCMHELQRGLLLPSPSPSPSPARLEAKKNKTTRRSVGFRQKQPAASGHDRPIRRLHGAKWDQRAKFDRA
jgi:hypothetical protein